MAAGRADLLAIYADMIVGLHVGDPDEEPYLRAAQLCIEAGANASVVPRWSAEGGRRSREVDKTRSAEWAACAWRSADADSWGSGCASCNHPFCARVKSIFAHDRWAPASGPGKARVEVQGHQGRGAHRLLIRESRIYIMQLMTLSELRTFSSVAFGGRYRLELLWALAMAAPAHGVCLSLLANCCDAVPPSVYYPPVRRLADADMILSSGPGRSERRVLYARTGLEVWTALRFMLQDLAVDIDLTRVALPWPGTS